MRNPSDQFEKALSEISELYETEIFVGAKKSLPAFALLVTIINSYPSEKLQFLELINKVADRFLSLKTAGEFRFAAEASEYFLKNVGWVEFFEHLEFVHSQIIDPSIRMKIEIAIKRGYNSDWKNGDYPSANFGNS